MITDSSKMSFGFEPSKRSGTCALCIFALCGFAHSIGTTVPIVFCSLWIQKQQRSTWPFCIIITNTLSRWCICCLWEDGRNQHEHLERVCNVLFCFKQASHTSHFESCLKQRMEWLFRFVYSCFEQHWSRNSCKGPCQKDIEGANLAFFESSSFEHWKGTWTLWCSRKKHGFSSSVYGQGCSDWHRQFVVTHFPFLIFMFLTLHHNLFFLTFS